MYKLSALFSNLESIIQICCKAIFFKGGTIDIMEYR